MGCRLSTIRRRVLEGGALRRQSWPRGVRLSKYGRASVQQKSSPGGFREKTSRKKKARIYGVGEASAGDSVVVAGDSVVVAGDSVVVVVVVVGGLVAAGLAAGSVVSVFCSHAARSAALARMQMYFFIVLIGRGILL
jgi:hypothetical protein